MVILLASRNHRNLRTQNFTINLRIFCASRHKIYKDLYSCSQDLWPVAGPLNFSEINFIQYNYTTSCSIDGNNHDRKESTANVHQFLQQVETKFSDVLISANQIVTQGYLGKGMYAATYI